MTTTLVLAFTGAVIGTACGVLLGVVESKQHESSRKKSFENISDTMEDQKTNQGLEAKLVYSIAMLLGLGGAGIGAVIGLFIEYTLLENLTKNTHTTENAISTVEENKRSNLEITGNNKFIFIPTKP